MAGLCDNAVVTCLKQHLIKLVKFTFTSMLRSQLNYQQLFIYFQFCSNKMLLVILSCQKYSRPPEMLTDRGDGIFLTIPQTS